MAELSFATPWPTQLPARLRQEDAPRPSRPSRTAAQLRTTGGGARGRAARGSAVLARLGRPGSSHPGRGVVPLPPAAPRPHRDNDAGADYTSQRAPWLGRVSGRCGGDALYCSAPRTSSSSGSGTRLKSASSRQACGCACSGAKNRSPKQPPTHPCLLSASCAGARWGCVDKKGPVSPIGRSHANPTPSD